MRSRTRWLLPLTATLLWLAGAAYPGLLAIGTLVAPATPAVTGYEPIRPAGALLLETTAYAGLVAIAAAVIGWGPGRVLGRRLPAGGFVPLAVLMLLPLCLPAYAVFYVWWQLWPADSPVHAWAVTHGMVPALRRATLAVALVGWSWPIVGWCVAGAVALTPAEHGEMLALDGAGRIRRLLAGLRAAGGGLALGALVVFLVVFDNTTCFDLAEVFTYGNELRAKDALGAPAGEVLRAALPAIAIASAGAVAVWIALAGRAAGSMRPGERSRGRDLPAVAGVATLLLATLIVPLVLLAGRVGSWTQVEAFVTLYGRDLAGSILRAVVVAGLGGLLAVGLTATWLDERTWVRRAAHAQAALWLAGAFVPATVAGIALEAAYNTALFADLVYRREAIVIVAHLMRFGFVAALLGWWAAAREPSAIADLRRTDGATGLGGVLVAAGPRLLAAGVAAAAIILVLALGEAAVTARVHPPGSRPLAMALLNDMHYQRPQTVIVAVLLLAVLALGAAAIVTAVWRGRRFTAHGAGSTFAALAVIVPALGLAGCTRDPAETRPLDPRLVFGTTGTALGQFSYPRAMAIDRERGYLYVVDKTARVQRFGLDGVAQTSWRMPEKENGKPTGVSVAPDGRVFVADTHYYRVIAYDPDGNEVMRFGSYGDGPGQFIYPTRVAFAPDGRLFVAEYGGHDRIQVFAPDGTYLSEFGSFGAEIGQFDRPQTIAFSPDGAEIYIADSCNHRIVVTDPDGNVRRSFGGAGTAPGRLHYPYGFTFLEDGTILVAEFGNNRLQRFAPDGAPLGLFGRLGTGEGELRYPWNVASDDGLVYILDSGNNRVQVVRSP